MWKILVLAESSSKKDAKRCKHIIVAQAVPEIYKKNEMLKNRGNVFFVIDYTESERVRSSRRALAKTLWQPKASPAQPIFRHELFFEWLNRQRQKFDNYLLPMLDLSYLLTSWNRVNNLCGTIRGFPVGPNCRNLWHFLSYISWYLWH